jgi:hypothetical protein
LALANPKTPPHIMGYLIDKTVEKGIDLYAPIKSGKSIYDLALQNKRTDVIQHIEKHYPRSTSAESRLHTQGL